MVGGAERPNGFFLQGGTRLVGGCDGSSMRRAITEATGIQQILSPVDMISHRGPIQSEGAIDERVVGLGSHDEIINAETEVIGAVEMVDGHIDFLPDIVIQVNGVFMPTALFGRHGPLLEQGESGGFS